MGTQNAQLTTDESVSNMIKLLTDPSKNINGKFFNYNGDIIKW